MAESNPTAPKSHSDPGEVSTPEDVATLYSWANLHGAKYRDFSASRAQAREEARLRVEEALAEQRRKEAEEAERRAQEEAQIAARLAAEAAEAARQAEAERLAEIARQAEAERQAVLAAQEAQRQAALQRSWQPPAPAGYANDFSPVFDGGDADADFDRFDHFPGETTFSSPSDFSPQFTQPLLESTPAPAAAWPESGRVSQPAAQSSNPRGVPVVAQPIQQRAGEESGGHGSERAWERGGAPTATQPPMLRSPQNPKLNPQQPSAAPQGTMYTTPATAYREYAPSPYASTPQESYTPSSWLPAESREIASGPAWLAAEMPAKSPVPTPPPPVRQPSAPAEPAGPRQSPLYGQGPAQAAGQPPGQNAYSRQHSDQFPGPYSGQFDDQGGVSAQPPYPAQESAPVAAHNLAAADDTLLASRDRIANRWYALKGVFDPQAVPAEQAPAQPTARVPVLAVFSLAGGVGKTSLVASLGRALSSRGERVLLVDTAAYGLLPFFFGARDQRPGQLRTFNPPGVSADAPIQLVTLDPESRGPDSRGPDSHGPESRATESEPQRGSQYGQTARRNPQSDPQSPGADWLAQEVSRCAGSANRILIDLPTASGATTRRVLRLNPIVLVPVLPDMNSVVSVGAIEAFFRNSAGHLAAAGGRPQMPFYLLNQFDYSLPLHLDVREILREQIGDRLIPFALRRSPSVSEALAEGMTVMDYAPNAVVAEDYANLAGWVRSVSAPAVQRYRGVRWSER